MLKFLSLLALVLAPSLAFAEASPQQRAVEAVIADSAAGWNTGDVARFMASYSDAPETSFVTGRGTGARQGRHAGPVQGQV